MPVRAASLDCSRWVMSSVLLLAAIAAVAVPLTSAPNPGAAGSTAPTSPAAIVPAPKLAPVKPPVAKPEVKPFWSDLTEAQKIALAPLATDWPTIDVFRKKKWIEIASRYPALKPAEQQRLQDRMRDWAKLSPDERRVAREIYTRTKTLAPDEKSAQWLEYQQLPDAEKQRLANVSASKKRVANLPAPLPAAKSADGVKPADGVLTVKPNLTKSPPALPLPLPLPTIPAAAAAPPEVPAPAVAPLPQPIPMIN